MKTKTKPKILRIIAVCILFLAQSHLMAQTSNAPTQIVCVGVTEPYTLVDPSTGPPTANYSYQWSITGGGTFVGGINTGNTINIDWNTVGVYTVSVIATDNITNCQDSPIDVVVTVEDLANTPVVSPPAPICLNDPNPTLTATTGGGTGNNVFNWYADAALTILLQANSATYTDPTAYANATTYSYWVTEESANSCEGSATQVDVIVTPLPAAPSSGSPYTACYGQPNPLMTASSSSGGSNFNWYDVTGTQVASNSPTYTDPANNLPPNSYTYTVEEIVGSCTSPTATVTLVVNPQPAAPLITPAIGITICEGQTPGDFTASGGASAVFTWYSDATLTTQISVGTTVTPSQTLPGIYTYYVTETDVLACTSVSSQVDFVINALPLIPIVSAAPSSVVCDGDVNPTFTASATPGGVGTNDFIWYDDAALTSQVGTGLTFTPTQTAVQLYTFYVTETNSATGCEGPPLLFTFEIIPLPAAPTITPNPYEICFGDPNPAFTPTGSSLGANLIWYDNAALTSQVGTGASFTPPASAGGSATTVTTYPYWVVDQPGTCVSPSLQVDLQINPLPTPGPIYHN